MKQFTLNSLHEQYPTSEWHTVIGKNGSINCLKFLLNLPPFCGSPELEQREDSATLAILKHWADKPNSTRTRGPLQQQFGHWFYICHWGNYSRLGGFISISLKEMEPVLHLSDESTSLHPCNFQQFTF